MIIVDIYGRVSTEYQSEEGYSLGEQEERLKAYCQAQGWIINNVLMDGGFTGSNMNRPALQQLIQDAEAHIINKVVVYKLDRLSRSQRDTMHIIEDILMPNGVGFVSMTESMDTSTPLGIAMVGILSAFAQLERSNIKMRTSLGKEARVKSGLYKGSGKIPIGFRYDAQQQKLVVDEYEAQVVREVFERYCSGATASSIATYLVHIYFRERYTWYSNNIKEMITNPIYIGIQRYLGNEYNVTDSPKIIDEDLFNKAQAEHARRSAKNKTKPQSPQSHLTLLGGIVWCGCCGERMTPIVSRGVRRYKCYTHSIKWKGVPTHECHNRTWRTTELNDIIFNEIKKIKFTSTKSTAQKKAVTEREVLLNKIRSLDEQMEKLIDLYSLGNIPNSMLTTKIDSIQKQKESIEMQLKELSNPSYLDSDELEHYLDEFSEIVDELQGEKIELYNTVRHLINSITLTNDDIAIEWNFET